MAKKTKDDFYSTIAASTGGLTFDTSGKVPYFVDTGNLALNFMCSGRFVDGGYPGGRIIEVFGPPATAKSLLGLCAAASCQLSDGIAVLLDCERAGNADFAEKAAHVNAKKLIVYEPISIEQVETKILSATRAIREHFGVEKPIFFIWDSIGVTPTEREWKEIDLPENPTAADMKKIGGNARPGERAKAAGDLLRKINPFINEHNVTLFIINQVRAAIGSYVPMENAAGGGMSLPFYASCRLRTSVGKMIESKKGLPLGVNLRFKNKKSRSSIPGIGTEGVRLFFEAGIDPLGGLLSILIATGRIEVSGKGRYKVMEPWAEGKEYAFQSSVARNDVPLDLLFDVPKIIDAESAEQVKEYLARHENAIKLATGDSILEKEVKDESDELDSILTANEEAAED